MSLLLGVNAFAARGDAAGRQSRALARCRELSGVRLANLGWPDDLFPVDGFASHPVLRADSRSVSGREGPRKPVLSEVFDRLAEIAAADGCRWFGYANSDVAWTPAAVEAVLAGGRDGYALARGDVDAAGGPPELLTTGVDGFVVTVRWWAAHRARFRPYLGGEPTWDNVYTAILLAHGDAELLNREPMLLHERHPAAGWAASPFRGYIAYLASLDSLYFTRWAVYHDRLLRARAAGADPAQERALQREVFRGRFSPRDRLVQAGRALRARARYALARRRP